MDQQRLPNEIVSLIHHIELNKVGWWDKCVQRIILAAIWLQGRPMNETEVQAALESPPIGTTLSLELVSGQMRLMEDAGILVTIPDGSYKISESASRGMDGDVRAAESVETAARKRFTEILSQLSPTLDPDKVWSTFNEKFLFPLFRTNGARVYEILSGQTDNADPLPPVLRDYLTKFSLELRPGVKQAILTFLDTKVPEVRDYLLSHLNAHFFLEAGSLRRETLEAIGKLANRRPNFTIFVDTNFLFCILGFDDHPAKEAVAVLTDTISRLIDSVPVRLYALPPTIQEGKRVLMAQRSDLADLRVTPKIAAAALETGLSEMRLKFIREASKKKSHISAETYFGPYIKNFVDIIRQKGVELFNEKLDHYATLQSVITDIAEQQEFEAHRYPRSAKSYEQLLHDIMLWHFVRDKRPAYDESPIEAEVWLVTLDQRLLAFDAYKRRESRDNPPICLHPTTLIQMLQLWIPRTSQLDDAILSSLFLPFIFHEFDPEAEAVTIKILKALSRFEQIDDISQETASAFLIDEALRQRMAGEGDQRRQVELIREALIEENKRKELKIQSLQESSNAIANQLREKESRVRALSDQQEALGRVLSGAKQDLLEETHKRELAEDRVTKIEQALTQANQRVESMEAELASEKNSKLVHSQRKHFATIWLVILVAGMAVLYLAVALAVGKDVIWWRKLLISFSIATAGWMETLHAVGKRKEPIASWTWFKKLVGLRVFIIFGLTANLLASALWNVMVPESNP